VIVLDPRMSISVQLIYAAREWDGEWFTTAEMAEEMGRRVDTVLDRLFARGLLEVKGYRPMRWRLR